MKSSWLWIAPALAAAGWGQTESAVTREGRQWVQTLTGTVAVEGPGRLRVSTRGALRLQGEDRSDVAYTLTKRARVSSEATARQLLSRLGVKAGQHGGWTTLAASFPTNNYTQADVALRVPRRLLEVELDSEGGALEAFDLAGTLKAETGGGRIHIDRIKGDLTIRTGGGEVQLGTIGRTVRISSGGGSITAGSIGGEAGFTTGGGEVYVREALGAVRASTGGGNIRVERAAGPVTAATGGGLVEVGQAGGVVAAESGAGSIKVRLAQGCRCEAGSGSIHLVSVFGSLRATTGAGSILAELLAGKPLEDSLLSTGSGDITVFIPSNLAVTIQAIATSPGLQKIISDFPEIQAQVQSRGGRAEAQGALNGGGPVLRLAAADGTIYLRRHK
ncbi:MAG: DUF4097 domain-containing protein [Acidobacteria bacterium]|nr:DUF4097 domain-containing protein [Acidobacteriota bacterium]